MRRARKTHNMDSDVNKLEIRQSPIIWWLMIGKQNAERQVLLDDDHDWDDDVDGRERARTM